MERVPADLDHTTQFMVLTMLAAYPGHSNADLARVALLTPQTVSVIVANLERMGALVRRPHAVHGRIQHLHLSASGRALLADCRARAHAVERELAGGLSGPEQLMVRTWLVRIATGEDARSSVT